MPAKNTDGVTEDVVTMSFSGLSGTVVNFLAVVEER